MSEFWIYLQLGFEHMTDINGYDHMLFILAMIAPYAFRDFKILAKLITAFTLGHSITLALAVFNLVSLSKYQVNFIELLIPITILSASIMNLFKFSTRASVKYAVVAIFGLVHGLGFSNYLKAIWTPSSNLSLNLLSFNIGLELGQILFLLICLILFLVASRILRIAQKDQNIFVSGGTTFASLIIIIEKLAS